MNSESQIEHTGIVTGIGDGSIVVKITAHPACSSCHASGVCNASGSVDKYFQLPVQDGITEGQNVRVITLLSTGFRALLMGYVYPLMVLLISLMVTLAVGMSEVLAGICSLLLTVLYYLVLYRLRGRIEKTINFTLKPA
jgi:sigma-E factor negative regulatory protein RseC